MARRPGKKDACVVVLLVGGSLFTGLAYLVVEATKWLV